MYNVLTLNKIAPIGTDRLGSNYSYGNEVENPDAILVRSAAMHDMEFADNLLAIARAGAGTNNIPKDKYTEKGIVVFNTPGANANAVKELVIAGLLISNRKVIEGYEWAKTLKGTESLALDFGTCKGAFALFYRFTNIVALVLNCFAPINCLCNLS